MLAHNTSCCASVITTQLTNCTIQVLVVIFSVLVINGLCRAIIASSGSAGRFLALRVVGDLALISLDTSIFVMGAFNGAISAFIDNCRFSF